MRPPRESTSVARGSLTTEQWKMPTSPAWVSRKVVKTGARGGSVWEPEVACHSQTDHFLNPLWYSLCVPSAPTEPWNRMVSDPLEHF